MTNWFLPRRPYTGTGDKPASSLPAVVQIVFRDKLGKPIKSKSKKKT